MATPRVVGHCSGRVSENSQQRRAGARSGGQRAGWGEGEGNAVGAGRVYALVVEACGGG